MIASIIVVLERRRRLAVELHRNRAPSDGNLVAIPSTGLRESPIAAGLCLHVRTCHPVDLACAGLATGDTKALLSAMRLAFADLAEGRVELASVGHVQ
jgi:hypothetical protein